MARHRRFTLEFKRLVVLDFLEKRLGLRELSRKHNLSRNLLSQWIRKYETGQLTDQIADAHRIAEYEGKIAELERKVGQLTMEIDLLKKGAQLARRPNAEIVSNNSIVSGPQVSPSRADAER
jgi:transposase